MSLAAEGGKSMPDAEAMSDEKACVTTQKVLIDEYDLIWGDGADVASPIAYYRQVVAKGQAALCLSGGGIRSAAVGLGVMQALSRGHLLTGFHYLSSVSGGGYIASWLQRWIHGRGDDATEVMQCLAGLPAAAAAAAGPAAAPAFDPKDLSRVEPEEVKHLRENSNFITPRVGIGSNDTWTAVAISVRNILINWLLFAPLFMVIATVPNLFLELIESIRPTKGPNALPVLSLLVAATACMAWATASTVRLMPSYRGKARNQMQRDQARKSGGDSVLRGRIVWPLVGWSFFATLSLSAELLGAKPDRIVTIPELGLKAGLDLPLFSLGGMVLGLLFGWIGLDQKRRKAKADGPNGAEAGGAEAVGVNGYAETFRKDWAIWPISFIVTTSWIAIGASLFEAALWDKAYWAPVTLAIAGPLWLLTGTLVGAAVFVAFRTSEGPRIEPDGDREWLGRLSAIKLKPMLFWAILATAVLWLNRLVGAPDSGESSLPITGLVTLISGAVAAFGGRSNNTASAEEERRSGKTTIMTAGRSLARYLPINAIISLATLVFIIALLVLFGRLEYGLASVVAGELAALDADRGWLLSRWIDMTATAHVVLLLLLGGLIVLFGRSICVNRFSLHGFYRNRLARAFLGAARPYREPDPFTGFDSGDNVRLYRLAPRGPDRGRVVLYPVINVALNVTATENLAWQERKAMPFVFTPLYCGSRMLTTSEDPPHRSHPLGAYVASKYYAGREPDFGMQEKRIKEHIKRPPGEGPAPDIEIAQRLAVEEDRGVSLATAMAISGAAATPNMGYYSSPATAFLMTLFNVRLGAWLPNPALAPRSSAVPARGRQMDVTRASPTNSIDALFKELIGRSHDRGPDVYLSDGGHFENLGLYEMIQRRCRYIVVSDASADPQFGLKALGNAVRKVKIDLDVDISFSELRLSRRGQPHEPPPQLAWALGEVIYPDREFGKEENLRGKILYLKPSFFVGDGLPVDVVAYARDRSDFPHESTVDQFFSESQFESYRRLADHFVSKLIKDAESKNDGRPVTMKELFRTLEDEVRGRGAAGTQAPQGCC
jgi:hypothetical protein